MSVTGFNRRRREEAKVVKEAAKNDTNRSVSGNEKKGKSPK